MLSEKAISAKKILEFYTDKMNEDGSNNAVFATQYANLHMLKFRIQGMLDCLESYDLEVK